jgi:hypothetical protein
MKFTWYTGELIDDGFWAIPIEAVDGRIMPERDFVVWRKNTALSSEKAREILEMRDVVRDIVRNVVSHHMRETYEIKEIEWVENFTISEDGTIVNYSYLWTPVTIKYIWWNKVEYVRNIHREIENKVRQVVWIVFKGKTDIFYYEYEIPAKFAKYIWLEEVEYMLMHCSGRGILVKKSDISEYENVPHPDYFKFQDTERNRRVSENNEHQNRFTTYLTLNLSFVAFKYCQENNLL